MEEANERGELMVEGRVCATSQGRCRALDRPAVSLIVLVCNMSREVPRTLHSLSASYQLHFDPDDHEVIVVDNGSNPPLDPSANLHF